MISSSEVQPVDEFANGNGFRCRQPHGFRFALPVATSLHPIRGVPIQVRTPFARGVYVEQCVYFINEIHVVAIMMGIKISIA